MNSKSNVSGWTKAAGGAKYAGVGLSTYRNWLKNGLRHIRLDTGTVLTKFEWIDEFLESYEVVSDSQNEIDAIVNETIDGFMND